MEVATFISIITAIGTIIGAVLTYRVNISKLKSELEASRTSAIDSFRDDLMSRIKQLEDDGNTLRADREAAWQKAATERKDIIHDYDAKIDTLRKDMRRQVDDVLVEMSTWRDRYWTLYADYEKLKIEHISLNARFEAQQKELDSLKIRLTTQEKSA